MTSHVSTNSQISYTATLNKNNKMLTIEFVGIGSFANGSIVFTLDSTLQINPGLNNGLVGHGQAFANNQYYNVIARCHTSDNTIQVNYSTSIVATNIGSTIAIPIV